MRFVFFEKYFALISALDLKVLPVSFGLLRLKSLVEKTFTFLGNKLTIFKKNNIVPVVSINEKLDPNKHQAMMEIEDDSKEPGTIVQEIQKGFMLKDRLLRPSLVGVSKKPQKTEQKEPKK